MKIAVTSTDPTLDASVGSQFRCTEYLLIVDLDTMEYEAMMNPAAVMMLSGLTGGKLFAQQLMAKGVWRVLAGDCSSNVLKSLAGTKIQTIDGMSGSVRDVIEWFKEISMADTSIISVEELQR